ncbi:2-C-methyl-D-erythritol 4-phosphate cytidylyltransferase [Parapedobacter defluvii]|uniref:2-C-methyl-D-erythritol 4-phosphate cytidylyltransferase n=2 Tax=Parapedobacter defluvii TaxID=2045106 RepID=A0ABQ1MYS6_9SPHI|nr:2-C-methyl-D-erythritol 4-phosphate cytidylyltransferase [Parapedobacter defluvii]
MAKVDNMQEHYAIVVGGGTGTRMGSDTPKQFLPLNGIPVAMHAIRAFHNSKYSPQIVVVIPSAQHGYWSELCEKYNFDIPHVVASGGKSRFESVKNGLAAVQLRCTDLSQSLIAVHDAARPLIAPTLIDATFDQAARYGAAALAIQSTNSVRLKSSNGLKNNAYPRQQVYLMQTPQTFNGVILSESYKLDEDNAFTDDASVVEKKGYPITLVDGDTRNIKITFPEDLRIAAILSGTYSGCTPDDTQ